MSGKGNGSVQLMTSADLVYCNLNMTELCTLAYFKYFFFSLPSVRKHKEIQNSSIKAVI